MLIFGICLFGAQFVAASVPPGAISVPFVRETTVGTLRNDFTGWVGMKFTIGENPVIVTALGRMVVSGNSSAHLVKLVDADEETDLTGGIVSVTTAGAAPGRFAYGQLPEPIVLGAGKSYYLVAQEWQNGDQWYDVNTRLVTAPVATNNSGAFTVTGTFYAFTGFTGNSYGPVDFLYATGGGLFPPTVRLLAPSGAEGYLAPATLTFAAEAQTSADGSITRVDFLANDVAVGQANAAPYTFTWNNVPGGIHVLRAVVTDSFNRRATSGVVTVTIVAPTNLVASGALWRYLDNGADLDFAWLAAGYDDAWWESGNAPFGYGDERVVTAVDYGPSPAAKYVTTFFRHEFTITDAREFTNLRLELLVDDGAIVYLNGVEVLRHNLPSDAVTADTLAEKEVGMATWNEPAVAVVPYGTLFDGTNVLAVEVHQESRMSADLLFDLKLLGCCPVTRLTRGPYLQRGSTSNIVVRWRTDLPTTSVVNYGRESHQLDRSAQRLALTTEHQVVLPNLLPDTRYYYAVGSVGFSLLQDPDLTFVTAPIGPKPTRIWVLGDSGTAGLAAAAVRDGYYGFASNRPPDLWLMLGDNAYQIGTDPQYQAAVFDMYPQTLRQSVLWPALGNHDTAFSVTPGPDLPYFNIFTLPTAAEAGGVPSGTEKYYSFDYGNIHFICLDSMTSDRASNGVMFAWLRQDLEGSLADWTIAFWHHPPYSRGSHDSDHEPELVEMRENFLPLLEAHGVDLVLSGHSHSYERSYFVHGHYGFMTDLDSSMVLAPHGGQIGENPPYQKAVTGPNAGRGAVYAVAGSSGQVSHGPLDHPVMFINLLQLGSMALDIDGSRLEARFIRETGEVYDSFALVKRDGGEPGPFEIVAYNARNGLMTVRFNSIEGLNYVIQYTADLASGNWGIAAGAQPATDTVTTRTFPLVPSGTPVFYRVAQSNED